MKKSLLFIVILSSFLLAIPALAANYNLTVTVTDDSVDENPVVADYIRIYNAADVLVTGCTGKSSCDFNSLGPATYKVSVFAMGYIEKNENTVLNADTVKAIRLTPDGTAPVTSISFSPATPNGEDDWYITDVTFTLSATDNQGGAGVKETLFCTDTSNSCNPSTPYASSQTISTEGKTYVRYYSKDKAENSEVIKSSSVKIDKTAPGAPVISAFAQSGGAAINEKTWQTDDDPYFSWTEPISVSPIAEYEWSLEGGDMDQTAANYLQFSQDSLSNKKYTFKVKARDGAGSWGPQGTFEIWVDDSTPDIVRLRAFTDKAGTEIAVSTWQRDGTPYFNWTDQKSPSGDIYYFTVDGSEPGGASASAVVPYYDRTANPFGGGTTTFKVKPRNGAGTWGETRIFTLKYDATPPPVNVLGAPANWQNVDATATVLCMEAGDVSGCDQATYKLYTNPGQIANCPANYDKYTLPDASEISEHSWVCAAAKDKVGNTGFSNPSEFKVDGLSPAYSDESNEPDSPTTYSPSATYTFSIKWTDGGDSDISDVAFKWGNKKYTLSGGEVIKNGDVFSMKLEDLPAGTYSYSWYAEDKAGNSAETIQANYVINKAAVTLKLFLNGAESDASQTYGTDSNATGTIDAKGLSISMSRNNAQVAGAAGDVSEVETLAAGTYRYTLSFAGNENYTAASLSKMLTINKAQTSIKFYLDGSEWAGDETRTYPVQTDVNATVDVASLQGDISISRNGAPVSNPEQAVQNAGTYAYTAAFRGNENYTESSATRKLVVNKALNPVTLLLNGAADNAAVTYGSSVNAAAGSTGGTVVLRRNMVDVSSENRRDVILGAGTYVYTATAVGNENYLDNQTGISFTATVNKAPTSLALYLDGDSSNKTAERGSTVNLTAGLDISGLVKLYVNDVEVATGIQNVQLSWATGTLGTGEYKITATFGGTENYSASSQTFFVDLQDTQKPVITLVTPENKTYQTDTVEIKITSNENLNSASYSLDGSLYQPLGGSGLSWSATVRSLSEGTHTVVIKATDTAGNTNDPASSVTFTVPKLGRIVNSTIDGVYYSDAWINIFTAESTILESEITDSTITNSTIKRSVVKGKILSKMWIEDSTVDPHFPVESSNSTIIGGSNVTDSQVKDSTVSDRSNVTLSSVVKGTVNSSTVYHSGLESSTALRSTVQESSLTGSSVTDSAIVNSVLANITAGSANVTNGFLYSGWLFYNGINYTVPANITAMLSGPDTESPRIIDPIQLSNSTPAPGDTVTVTVRAVDNVAVESVSINNSAAVFDGIEKWSGTVTIPAENGTFSVQIIVKDYATNNLTRYLGMIINTSETPQVRFDLSAPVVSRISPASGEPGSIAFTAAYSDDTGVSSCWLYVSNVNTTEMQLDDGTARGSASLSGGNYPVYARCLDNFGNTGNGAVVNVVISSPAPPSGGPGGGSFFGGTTVETRSVSVDVPESLTAKPGESVSIGAQIKNTGTAALDDITVEISGVPVSWLSFNSKIPQIGVNKTSINIITLTIPKNETGSRTITLAVGANKMQPYTKSITLSIVPEAQNATAPATIQTTITEQETGTQTAPSGITGALVSFINNPFALAGAAIVILAGGSVLLSRRRGKSKKLSSEEKPKEETPKS